jgi:heme-degrading monooxygenase HmoA
VGADFQHIRVGQLLLHRNDSRRQVMSDQMIWEIAQINVLPGTEAEVEKVMNDARPLLNRATGCRGVELRRSVEKPSRYRLIVTWETVEHHTLKFRQSPDFETWRGLVWSHFRPRRKWSMSTQCEASWLRCVWPAPLQLRAHELPVLDSSEFAAAGLGAARSLLGGLQ